LLRQTLRERQGLDISEGLAEALDNWVVIRNGLYFQPLKGNKSDALFLSCNGRRLCGDDIYQILRSYGDAAGVKISLHRVRHSAITAFLDASGGDVRSPLAQGSYRRSHCRGMGI
jgi:integrase/recombinase XerC